MNKSIIIEEKSFRKYGKILFTVSYPPMSVIRISRQAYRVD